MKHPENYITMPGISNSMMKVFEENVSVYHKTSVEGFEKGRKSSESMRIGDLFEMLYVAPEQFGNYYFLITRVPDARVKEILEDAIETFSSRPDFKDLVLFENPISDWIRLQLETNPIHSGWKMETQYQKVQDSFEYWETLKTNLGKEIINAATLANANILVDKAKNSPNFQFINDILQGKCPHIDVFLSEAIMAIMPNGMRLKGLLDMMYVDHDKKEIGIVDFKTAESFEQFIVNYFMSRYYRQGSIYFHLVTQEYGSMLGYKVNNPIFAVVSKTKEEDCRIYQMSDYEVLGARYGATTTKNNRIYGWETILNDINWHMENNLWENPRAYYEKGLFTLDNFKHDNGTIHTDQPDQLSQDMSELFGGKQGAEAEGA